MEIPIESALSSPRLEVARLQDRLIETIYNYVQSDAVLYGGTAIWRCFNGGRFSEDIDIYVAKGFGGKFETAVAENGLSITWRDEELQLGIRVSDGKASVLVEAKEGKPEGIIAQYIRTDGTSMTITALSPEELLVRKIEAYGNRGYIRDIYDMVQLTNYIDSKDPYISQRLGSFLVSVEKPVDKGILRSLVYKGNAMDFDEMLSYLKRWAGEV